MEKLLHTPEGVRDIYNHECAKKLALQNNLHRILHMYGYQDIQTPTYEYYEVFNHERGTIDSKEMYKFFDRDGNILVLRPDITPSIARSVAKYYNNTEMALRFCYIGNTFRNNESYQGKLRECTQLGAELIGDDSPEADAEILAMVIHSILETGLTDFQVEIGQVEFFKGLVEEANIDSKTEEQLRLLIDNKNFFGVEEVLSEQSMSEELKQVFLKLPELFGSLDKLEQAKKLTNNKRALNALKRLEEVYNILSLYGFQEYITFDLGMINELNYYTGIIFRGYTYGTGVAIVTGGRYDTLIKQFGKDAASVGFAIVIDELMLALSRQKIETGTDNTSTLILYNDNLIKSAIELAYNFRKDGLSIELQKSNSRFTLDDYINFARLREIGGILWIEDEDTIKIVDIKSGNITIANLSDFAKEVN